MPATLRSVLAVRNRVFCRKGAVELALALAIIKL